MDAFSSRLGVSQGRIPHRLPAASNEVSWAFVLGEEEPGHIHMLQAGDYAELSQEADLTDVRLVRVYATLRAPPSTVATLRWQASLGIDGQRVAAASARPGRSRILTDLAADVSKLSGLHTLAIRLELREA